MSKKTETSLPACGGAGAPPTPENGAPSAEAYRIKEEDIDHATCVGRILKGGKDMRWKPAVYREFQCGKPVVEECDLCKTCQARLERFAEDPKSCGHWNGRITEEPHGGVHMLGTEWAEARKPKWLGVAVADSGSEASSVDPKAAKIAEKEAIKQAWREKRAAEKEAAKRARDEERAAAKAAKAAEKEAARAAKVKKAAAPPPPALDVEEVSAPAAAVDPRDVMIAALTAERDAAQATIATLRADVAALVRTMRILDTHP